MHWSVPVATALGPLHTQSSGHWADCNLKLILRTSTLFWLEGKYSRRAWELKLWCFNPLLKLWKQCLILLENLRQRILSSLFDSSGQCLELWFFVLLATCFLLYFKLYGVLLWLNDAPCKAPCSVGPQWPLMTYGRNPVRGLYRPAGGLPWCLPTMRETRVQSLGREDLEKEVATHSSILTWKIPGLQSMGSQRVGHNWGTLLFFLFYPSGQLGVMQKIWTL